MAITSTALVIANEVHKGLLIYWSYKFNTVTMLVRLSFFFVGVSLVVGRGHLDAETLVSNLLGFIIWFYAAIGITNMSVNLTEESQAGTLEQVYMTTVNTGMIALGRSLATVVVSSFMVLLIATALTLIFGLDIPLRWEALPVFGLIMLGLFGLGFMNGGATLVFKQVHQLANFAENILLWLSGTLLPVALFPGWLETFSKFLPATEGIIVLREVVLGGSSLSTAWANGSLPLLIANSAAYLIVGWLVFKWGERISKGRGVMGQY